MGIADWIGRRKETPVPGDLLEQLIDGFRREDYQRLMTLVNAHSAEIRQRFPSWMRVPADIRADADAIQLYTKMLVTIARVFEKSGDRSLVDRLMPSDNSNPLVRWQQDLEQAQTLIDGGRAADAIVMLRGIVDEVRRTSGTAVDYFLPRALGKLGVALAATAHRTEAIEATREALELCQRAGDQEGVRAYTANLRAIGTHDIRPDDGIDSVVLVFTDGEGRMLAADELAGARGTIKWEVVSRRAIDPEAARLHREGRAAGERGDYDAALSLLTEAANHEPAWAYPIYDRAFTHLLRENFDEARRDYERTLELSPRGFYTAAEAVDMLRRAAAGEWPSGVYTSLVALERVTPDQQRVILEQLVEAFPSCAGAWDRLANCIEDLPARLRAIERGLAAPADPDTRGSLLVKKALALHGLGQTAGALEILTPLTATVGDSLSTHANAYIALAVIRSGNANDPTS